MQILKCSLILGVAFSVLPLRADPAAQAKAREALEQKLKELQSQPQAEPAAAASQSTTPAPAKKGASKPAPTQPVPPTVTQRPMPPAAVAAPATTAAAAPAAAASAAPAPVAMTAAPPPAPSRPVPTDPEKIAKAREELQKKMAELANQPASGTAPMANAAATPGSATPQTVAMVPAPTPPPPPKAKEKAGPLHFEPMQAPALPISADKAQRLEALLQKYKADQLSPEQYHAERAKILAEP